MSIIMSDDHHQQPAGGSEVPKSSMTDQEAVVVQAPSAHRRRRCRCLIVGGGILLLILFLIFLILLILVLTVFKTREPKIQPLSASLDGISPRISFPVIKIELNITLDTKVLVKNPNRASFRHGGGKSILVYRDKQVGEANIYPGYIPSRGSVTVASRITIEADRLASTMTSLINDVLAGEIAIESQTRLPGRVNFLGIFKKHVVAKSKCQFTIALPSMTIKTQHCKTKT